MGAQRKGGRWVLPLLALALMLGSASIGLFIPDTNGEKRARDTLHVFMTARLARDEGKVRSLLTRRFHAEYVSQSELSLIGGVDPHYHKYALEYTRKDKDAWVMGVRITEEMAGKGDTGWFKEEVSLVPFDTIYLVDNVTRGEYHPLQP